MIIINIWCMWPAASLKHPSLEVITGTFEKRASKIGIPNLQKLKDKSLFQFGVYFSNFIQAKIINK